MSYQPGANIYTQGFGSRPENVEVPHLDVRAPNTTDYQYPIGKRWIDQVGLNDYTLVGITSIGGVLSGTWNLLGTNTGALNTLTGGSGGAISPSAGNITLAGTIGQITTTGSGSTITWSLTSAITAPGSLSSAPPRSMDCPLCASPSNMGWTITSPTPRHRWRCNRTLAYPAIWSLPFKRTAQRGKSIVIRLSVPSISESPICARFRIGLSCAGC